MTTHVGFLTNCLIPERRRPAKTIATQAGRIFKLVYHYFGVIVIPSINSSQGYDLQFCSNLDVLGGAHRSLELLRDMGKKVVRVVMERGQFEFNSEKGLVSFFQGEAGQFEFSSSSSSGTRSCHWEEEGYKRRMGRYDNSDEIHDETDV